MVALDGVGLAVASGQVHGLVGSNGAGKTTLFGLLLGLVVADGGGRLEIVAAPGGRTLAVSDSIAGFVNGPGFCPSFTAWQKLSAVVSLRGCDAGRWGGRSPPSRSSPRYGRVDQALQQVDVTADGRCVADGDGPKEVNGYFQLRTSTGDTPNPLWQFDGNVDLLTSTTKE